MARVRIPTPIVIFSPPLNIPGSFQMLKRLGRVHQAFVVGLAVFSFTSILATKLRINSESRGGYVGCYAVGLASLQAGPGDFFAMKHKAGGLFPPRIAGSCNTSGLI